MLTNDTATEDDQMSSIMEQPVAIMEFFQPKDENGKSVRPDEGWDKIDPRQVLSLIDEEWRTKNFIAKCPMADDISGGLVPRSP